MNAGLDLNRSRFKRGLTPERCAVVSIYEDVGGRDVLLRLCGLLVARFKDQLEFQFDWCRFKYLADPEIAMESAGCAARADLILWAAQAPELPRHVQNWFEGWLPKRTAADGALVVVQSAPSGGASPVGAYLRLSAHRAHLDYLTLFQPGLPGLPTDDEPPIHWGINE